MNKRALLAIPLAASMLHYSPRSEAVVGAGACVLTGIGAITSVSCGQVAVATFATFLGLGVVAFVSQEGGLANGAEFGGSTSGFDPQPLAIVIFKAHTATPELKSAEFKTVANEMLSAEQLQSFMSFWPLVETSFDQALADARMGKDVDNMNSLFSESLRTNIQASLSSNEQQLLSQVTKHVVEQHQR